LTISREIKTIPTQKQSHNTLTIAIFWPLNTFVQALLSPINGTQ